MRVPSTETTIVLPAMPSLGEPEVQEVRTGEAIR
jgi:hypothetical protein